MMLASRHLAQYPEDFYRGWRSISREVVPTDMVGLWHGAGVAVRLL
jgi:hypothetical protein